MSTAKDLYRVLNKGGVLSPALFARILDIAEEAGNKYVHLGSRQDILFYLPDENRTWNELSESGISLQRRSSGMQNVVSSYVCVDILPSTSWVHSGAYLKVLDQFADDHLLRVNIVDPRQNLVPLFSGHLNFIASEMPNYWHLYLNLDQDKDPMAWPGMIFTDDIAGFAREIEGHIVHEKIRSYPALVEIMKSSARQKQTLESTKEVSLPSGFFPDYEGLSKMDGKEQYWAGFYWRNNCYPVQFLKDVCRLCQNTNIGKISFTPWKTFLIKDIGVSDKIYWDELIGRNGINMRHSSFELNWHVPLLDQQAHELKRYLVSEFDQFDIRTFGLSFAIQKKSAERFTTIVIRSGNRIPLLGKYDFTRTYSIEYAYDFNPNNNHYIEFATGLSRNELPQALKELTKRYYSGLFLQNRAGQVRKKDKPERIHQKAYQCPDCLTIYDERYGDVLAGIPAGISFNQLPGDYRCQVCETPKTAFASVDIYTTSAAS